MNRPTEIKYPLDDNGEPYFAATHVQAVQGLEEFDNGDDISNLNVLIKKLNADISTVNSNIADISVLVNNQKTEIDNLKTQMNNANTEIDNLKKRIEILENKEVVTDEPI
ncbi:hypothetical protein JRU67_09145 [Mammaliicoccus sciuri]|uniref:Uncharacterized protein n=1 Tax=Mammaliicoccus sciuri TaxID=1296 RepID=A0AB37HHR2_MAMSC|nr:hypothetical protein [Mammaliicoccus sciuri]QRN90227.1 hypothetical protein JRU67_09145 [Mammaliicoccus sciuri]